MPQNPLYAPPSDGPPERPTPPAWGVANSGADADTPTPAWTVSQLVSYNLLRARRARGWTQQEFGDALGGYTGRAWSNASVSAAERAWQGGRPRKFDVDEIHAFCAIFDVPLAYFLLPPEGDFLIISPMGPDEENVGKYMGTAPVEYLKRILGVDPTADFVDRAQAAVSEHASLDFFPAKWEWDAGGGAAPDHSQPGHNRVEKVPAEETVENAQEARKRLEEVVNNLGLSDEQVGLLVKARSDELAHGVALQLEKWGFLKVPEIEEEIRDLRERVKRLSDGRGLD